MSNKSNARAGERGMVLIEALIAVLIFSIGILAVIGLQAGSIAAVADAKYRVDAGTVANRLLGVLWANSTTLSAGTTAGAVTELPSGAFSQTLTAITDPLDPTSTIGYTAAVVVNWQPPNATTAHTFSATANIYPK